MKKIAFGLLITGITLCQGMFSDQSNAICSLKNSTCSSTTKSTIKVKTKDSKKIFFFGKAPCMYIFFGKKKIKEYRKAMWIRQISGALTWGSDFYEATLSTNYDSSLLLWKSAWYRL